MLNEEAGRGKKIKEKNINAAIHLQNIKLSEDDKIGVL